MAALPSNIFIAKNINTRSSTETKLVGADNASTMILWVLLFVESQNFGVDKNIIYQYNKSTVILENNDKKSSSKHTRALKIRYLFLTDQIEKGYLSVEYLPDLDIIGNFVSKILQGKMFQESRKLIMRH